jgi:hypothetical protein
MEKQEIIMKKDADKKHSRRYDMDRTNEFKQELLQFLSDRKIVIERFDNYDGEDEYCGSEFYFKGEDIFLAVYDIEEVIS